MIATRTASHGSVVPFQATFSSTKTRLHKSRYQFAYATHGLLKPAQIPSRAAQFFTLSPRGTSSQSKITADGARSRRLVSGQVGLRRYNYTGASTVPHPSLLLLQQQQLQLQLCSPSRLCTILCNYQVANMSTRRSARLSAASDLKSSSSSAEAGASAKMAAPPAPVPAKRGRKRKADTETESINGDVKEAAEAPAPAPTTPSKRRARKTSAAAPPETPTPSKEELIAEPATAGETGPEPKSVTTDRAIIPNATNVLLLSPETSRVVASQAAAKIATTKASFLEEANRHLISVDARMRPLIEKNYCRIFSPEGLAEKVDPFESLCSSIISQQVSGPAAAAVKKKFVELFVDDNDSGNGDKAARPFPHPSQVEACEIERLRAAGLSQRKSEYVQGLARSFGRGELSAELLADAPFDEVLARVTAVKGLGRWTAEMFACFGLRRADVFSLGDLGVQRGMAAFVGRDVARLRKKSGNRDKFKYMSVREMEELSAPFAPYRSLFMWYMWKVDQSDVSSLE